MSVMRLVNDNVQWYLRDLTSRIVAKSGIPSDQYHLGKMIQQGLMDAPDFVLQIDGSTGESETSGSVLERSVRCAKRLRALGVGHGDVMILMAPNHLDITVPFYAAFYLGITVLAVDRNMPMQELQEIFKFTKPTIIFCQNNVAYNAQMTMRNLNMTGHIVTFDEGDHYSTLAQFMEQYEDDEPVEDFKCSDFDPETSIAFIVTTSGSTGMPKGVAHSHKYFAKVLGYTWMKFSQFPTPTRLAMIASPLQWSTALASFIRSPILRYTRLQTSTTLSPELAFHLINTYRPTYAVFSPTLMTTFFQPDKRDKCDFTCFEFIQLSGLFVPQSLIDKIKTISPNTEVLNIYGMSELAGLGFLGDNPAPGSCGKPIGFFQYRLLNVETHKDIHDSNLPGELWMKGPSPFMGYYNDIESTRETYTKDGWLKTGDIFYRDENWNFFFVDRIKLQLKCLYLTLSPLEIEGVIRKHPGVLDVAVTSVPSIELGDLPVACVVPRAGAKPSADEIKNLVKDTLQDAKRLRGGVIFMDAIPMTTSTKVHRRKLKELALVLPRA